MSDLSRGRTVSALQVIQLWSAPDNGRELGFGHSFLLGLRPPARFGPFLAGFASFHSFTATSLMREGPADHAHAPQITK
jgi:hypothetical protein